MGKEYQKQKSPGILPDKKEELRIRFNYIIKLWDQVTSRGTMSAYAAKMADVSLMHAEILARLVESILPVSGAGGEGKSRDLSDRYTALPAESSQSGRSLSEFSGPVSGEASSLLEKEKTLCRKYNFHLNFASLTPEDRKVLRKFRRQFRKEPSVEYLLSVTVGDLVNQSGWGRKSITWLKSFQKKLRRHLLRFRATDLFRFQGAGPLLVAWKPFEVDLKFIDQALVYDFDHILSDCSNELRFIAMSRWSFRCEHQSLEEIGRQFHKTRERIRQLECSFNEVMISCLRLSPPVLKFNLDRHKEENLARLLPELARCFTNVRYFYEFLDRCSKNCGEETYLETQWVDLAQLSFQDLEAYIAENPGPYTEKDLIKEIGERCQLRKVQAETVLNFFESQGRLLRQGHLLTPGLLHKNIAVAHVLLRYPGGLHWTEVYRKIREKEFLKQENVEDRLDASFTENSRIFLVGQGTYCHKKFLGVDESYQDLLLEEARKFLHSRPEKTANLQAVWTFVNKNLPVKYFTLRSVVSSDGAGRGFYFDGASRNDTLSLRPRANRLKKEAGK